MEQYIYTPIRRGQDTLEKFWPIFTPFKAYVAGGYARWMVSDLEDPAPAGDVDIFAPHGKAAQLKAHLLTQGYEVSWETDNAWSMAAVEGEPRLQVIKDSWIGEIVEVTLDFFDFTIVQAAVMSPDRAIVSTDFHNDECRKLLRLVTVEDSTRTLLRMMKYARKGYTLRPAEALRFLENAADYDDDYWQEVDGEWDEEGEF